MNWGIIGCGDVVERKSGPSILRAGRSRIVAAMRRDRSKARDFAERFGAPHWSDDARAVIERADVDIVYVATPPNSHLEYVLAAAGAGKHVLVEKPMAMSADEARRMIQACEGAGVGLFVAYYRRFQPHVQQMRQWLHEERIGRPTIAVIDMAVLATETGWRFQPEISGGGLFVDIGSHRLDVMFYLMGAAEEVHAVRARFDPVGSVEQSVTASLRFRSGALGAVTADYYTGRRLDRFAIYGSHGAILAENLDSQTFQLATPTGVQEFSSPPWPEPHLGLIRHIENVLLDGKANEVSGEDGLATEEVLDRIRV